MAKRHPQNEEWFYASGWVQSVTPEELLHHPWSMTFFAIGLALLLFYIALYPLATQPITRWRFQRVTVASLCALTLGFVAWFFS